MPYGIEDNVYIPWINEYTMDKMGHVCRLIGFECKELIGRWIKYINSLDIPQQWHSMVEAF
jgi:hypothetical protein